MQKLFLLMSAVALSNAGIQAQESFAGTPWPQDGSDLKPDQAIVFGRLPSGFRYAILPNVEPPKRVSLRLYVNTGSLMEEDDQQGLAHFLEHMAFNGTKNFAAGQMKEYFQRLKMSFGADTNAHTSFKETVYKLELPEGTDAYFKDALTLFRDYAEGMLLQEKEIDNERGVIKSEKLARDSVDYRMMVEGFKFSLPESLIPKRLPIGEVKVIETAPRERFVSYYQKWYTADRMVLVAVGDVKPAELAEKIKAKFGDLKPAAQTLPDPDFGKVSSGHGLITKLFSDKEAGETTISMDLARPSRRRPDNGTTRFENLVSGLAESMINRRLSILSRKENAPFIAAQASTDDFLEFVESSSLQLTCKPEQWEKALAAGEQELRRALKFGFTAGEFEEAKANLLTEMENAAQQAATRRSQDLSNQLIAATASKRVFTSPADDLARVRSAIKKIAPEACHEQFRKNWDSEDLRIFVAGNLTLENGDAKVKEAFLKSRSSEVTPPAKEESQSFAYTNFGTLGKVAKREEAKDLGMTLVTFENNVRLNLKPTNFAKDTIFVSVNFGAGKLTAPKDKPGLQFFTNAVFDTGALEKHSADDLERLLAGRTASVNFGIGDEFFNLSGKTNQKDLLLQFQLLCAQVIAPGYRDEGVRQLKLGLDAIYTQLETTPEGILQSQTQAFLRNQDPRFVFGSKEELKQRNMAEVKAWLAEPLTSSFMEIAVVGDFDVESAIQAAAATFGALPVRPAQRPDYAEDRKVGRTQEKDKTYSFKSTIPKAVVAVFWPTTDRRKNITLSRQLNLLASILDDMVMEEVREKMGDSYSPDVHSIMSDSFDGEGAVAAYLICEGKNSGKIAAIVKEIAAKLAAEGATADQLLRAREPLMKMIEDQKRNNAWWLQTVAAQAQSSPQRLDWARTMTEDYGKVTVEDINKLAKEYLGADRAISVKIAPEGVASAQSEAPKSGEKSLPAAKPKAPAKAVK